jgi:hypothetical protein
MLIVSEVATGYTKPGAAQREAQAIVVLATLGFADIGVCTLAEADHPAMNAGEGRYEPPVALVADLWLLGYRRVTDR